MLVYIINAHLGKLYLSRCVREICTKNSAFLSNFSPLKFKVSLLVFDDISPVGFSVK
jgi:hypothetical protein